MNKTGIEWTDRTWNPMTGCYGPGGTKQKPKVCVYCYARKVAETKTNVFPHGFKPVFMPDRLALPGKVKKPQTVFVGSMTDMMGEWWRDQDILQVMDACAESPRHTFLWLTKNPGRYASFIWPDNCWLGTTVTGPKDLKRIGHLINTPNVKRFLSIEPMRGYIDLIPHLFMPHKHGASADLIPNDAIGQVILGGETGQLASPMDLDWVRGVQNVCRWASVPFFFKGWGDIMPIAKRPHNAEYVDDLSGGYEYKRVGKKKAGRLLDGREHTELAWGG